MAKISELTGNSYKVQYMPEFSLTFKEYIKSNVTPSMISNPDDQDETGLYSMDQIIEFIEEVKGDDNELESLNFSATDIDLYHYIKNSLKITYIEF